MIDYSELNKNQLISERDTFSYRRYKQFFDCFESNFSRVLDFGCNTGRGGTLLKKMKPELELVGADIVLERLNKINKEVYSYLFNPLEMNIDLVPGNFDVIILGEVVEHIPFVQMIHYLKEFYNKLNDNGLLLITTPNPDSILVHLGRKSVLEDPTHINIMKRSFLKILIEKIGFRHVKIRGSGRAIKFLGEKFPIFGVYGSYLLVAKK